MMRLSQEAAVYPARGYYDLIVRPTVEEFFAQHDDPRRGMLACMALLHTVDHVFQNRSADGKKAEQEITRFNDTKSHLGQGLVPGTGTFGYATVQAFANASKHARLTRAKLNPGFGSKDYEIVAPGFVGELECNASYIGDEVGGVTVLWGKFSAINLKDAIEHTMGVLEAEFHELTDPIEEAPSVAQVDP
jgi:hypothetical protein